MPVPVPVMAGRLSAGPPVSVVVGVWLDSVTVPHFTPVVVVLGMTQTVGGGAQNAHLPAAAGRHRPVPVNDRFPHPPSQPRVLTGSLPAA
jgi:hypothetical protein